MSAMVGETSRVRTERSTRKTLTILEMSCMARRDHDGGKLPPEFASKCRDRQRPVNFGYEAGHQMRLPGRPRPGHDHGLAQRVEVAQRLFDFGDFDPMARQLHLVIFSSHVNQATIRQSATQVPGAVHPFVSPAVDRQERGCAKVGPVPEATGQTSALHHDLAHPIRPDLLPVVTTPRIATIA
jgi:hypothetical protein